MMQGIIGRKLGMTQVFMEDRTVAQVTAIAAGPCLVTQIKRVGKEGYDAIQLGFGEAKRLNSPEKGHLKKLGMFKHLREFEAEDIAAIQLGQVVDVSIFKPGDLVDVTGISKGKGFAGVVKRYHFAGGPKTHGQSDRHRAPGSIGATTSPGRVFKGKKMPGHMGSERVTVRHLKVIEADADRNLLLVRGGVPGARNGLVTVRKSTGQRETLV
ncbi:MAG TPA: 50S ribosomal protein L3 [Dehalococcoidia bacterium]|nr:50S ribosomal protein L3 [Dehalococcoidia bacterium]